MVDAQDLVVAQHMAQPGVQFARRVQVVAERFLDRDPAVAHELGCAEVHDDRAEKRRRHFQVEQRPLAAADLGGEFAVQRVVGDVTGQVGDPAGEPAENRLVEFLAGTQDRLAGMIHQLLGGDLVAGHPDDRAVEQLAALQAVQRAEGHLSGEITGNAEDHQQVGVAAAMIRHFRKPPLSARAVHGPRPATA